MLRLALVASFFSLFPTLPQGPPGKVKDACVSNILTTIPVCEVQVCAVTPSEVLIVSTHQVVATSPSMVYLSGDQKTLAIGFVCGGEGGWINLPGRNAPLTMPPGTYEISWTDKFERTVRVVVPCNGLTEPECAKIFQARVVSMEKMFPPKAM